MKDLAGHGFLRLRTNAKLNLFLRVVGKRLDGYHEIESIFHSIDLADDVVVQATTGGPVTVQMSLDEGLEADLPSGQENLVTRAAEQLKALGASDRGARIEILKRIPVGAGLGGGSANAAGVLLALEELWDLGLEKTELAKVAEVVGSDVSFALGGGTALAMEKGGDLTALPFPGSLSVVLGISFAPLSTKDVYETWDEVGGSAEAGSAPMALALGAGEVEEVAGLLHNDLEVPAAALRPELPDKKERLLEAGALGAGMSGSGPTMFGVARDPQHAADVAERVRPHFDRVVQVTSAARAVERVE